MNLNPLLMFKSMGAEAAINMVKPYVPQVLDFMLDVFTTMANVPPGERSAVLFMHAADASGKRTVVAKVYTVTAEDVPDQELAVFDVNAELARMDVKAMMAKLKADEQR